MKRDTDIRKEGSPIIIVNRWSVWREYSARIQSTWAINHTLLIVQQVEGLALGGQGLKLKQHNVRNFAHVRTNMLCEKCERVFGVYYDNSYYGHASGAAALG